MSRKILFLFTFISFFFMLLSFPGRSQSIPGPELELINCKPADPLPVNDRLFSGRAEVIEYSYQIAPREYEDPEKNFPLRYARWIGDLNNDGNDDMVFNHYVGDERTPGLSDALSKSFILYEADLNGNTQLFYGKSLHYIGDFNGDGIDDAFDRVHDLVHYGSNQGIGEDGVELLELINIAYIYPVGDVNGDGKDDFLGCNAVEACYILGGDPEMRTFTVEGVDRWDDSRTLVRHSDVNADGKDEIVLYNENIEQIVTLGFNEASYTWTTLGILDYTQFVDLDRTDMADLNGDGRIDFYAMRGFTGNPQTLEILPGLSSSPFFSEEAIVIGIPTTVFQMNPAGDFNNDGYHDLVAYTEDDLTPGVYLGNPDLSEGMDHIPIPLEQGERLDFFHYPYRGDHNNDGYDDLVFNYSKLGAHDRITDYGIIIIEGSGSNLIARQPVASDYDNASVYIYRYGVVTNNLSDINADGFEDWGVLSWGGAQVDIFFGGSMPDMEADVTIQASQLGGSICYAMEGGDINGDYLSDLIFSVNSNDHDRVLVYFGRSSWPDSLYESDADIVIQSPDPEINSFGYKLELINDYNGDDYPDLVISCVSHAGSTNTSINHAWVISGGPEFDGEIDMEIFGDDQPNNSFFGYRLAAAGDLNNDGYDEIVTFERSKRRVLVFFGGPQADSEYDMIIGEPVGATSGSFGYTIARNEGDFDNDGFSDLAIGGLNDSFEGIIYIYRGGPDFDNEPDFTLTDPELYNTNYGTANWAYQFSREEAYDLVISCEFSMPWDALVFKCDGQDQTAADYVIQAPSNDAAAGGLGGLYQFGIGNFNRDKKLDLIMSQMDDSNLGVGKGMSYFFESPVEVESNGIKEPVEHIIPIDIYPNPATSLIHVSGSFEEEDLFARIWNESGVEVYSAPVHASESGFHFHISQFSPGVYILQLLSGDRQYMVSSGSFAKR